MEPSRNAVVVSARQATWAGGIDSLESIPGPFKRLKLPSQSSWKKDKKNEQRRHQSFLSKSYMFLQYIFFSEYFAIVFLKSDH